MSWDWVPCSFYDGSGIAVATNAQEDRGLMSSASWNTPVEIIGDIEGEDSGYWIERIVGYWSVTDAGVAPSRGHVIIRCLPGFQNTITGLPIVPGFIDENLGGVSSDDSALSANEKWWWERIVPAGDIYASTSGKWARCEALAHPYSYMADMRPNVYVAENMVPAISISNSTDQDVLVYHRWRMLVRSRG